MTFLLRRERRQIRKQVEAQRKGSQLISGLESKGLNIHFCHHVFKMGFGTHLVTNQLKVQYKPLGLYWTKFSSYNGWHFPNES